MSQAGTPTYPVGTIAKLLLLTERRVQQLTAEGVIPKAERGRYELAPAVQGYIRYLQERSLAPSKGGGPVDYHAEKARLTKAQADTAEIELAMLRGEVASIKDFERAQAGAFASIRTNCLNIPQRVVTQLLGETDETIFKEKLREEITRALVAASEEPIALEDEDGEASTLGE